MAQSVWGDSGMWYLIADANGLASSDELTPGDSLKIPNVVSSTHNDATTFKPYDPDDVIGNINPSPKAPPPPKPKKKKSGGLATIVMVVVAVVATVFTAGAATAVLSGAATTLGGAAAAGTAALSAAAAGTAATISLGGAIIGAAVGSAVSQAVGMGMGAVDKFSWGQVAVSGITGALLMESHPASIHWHKALSQVPGPKPRPMPPEPIQLKAFLTMPPAKWPIASLVLIPHSVGEASPRRLRGQLSQGM
ncbi:hypothetical protein QZH47_09450 [Pseudomonas corrugata]